MQDVAGKTAFVTGGASGKGLGMDPIEPGERFETILASFPEEAPPPRAGRGVRM